MKKEYISPKAITVKIQTTGMLAISNFDESLDKTNTINAGDLLGREFEFEFEDTNKPLEDDDDFDY